MLFKSNKFFELKSKKTLVKPVIQKLILLNVCSYCGILTTSNQFMSIFQNHSSSGSHSPYKKFSLRAKYMIPLLPVGGYPPPTSYHYQENPDIKTCHCWFIGTSNGQPKCMSFHKAISIINRIAHCFHEYTQNVLKQKIKLEAHFVKNSYISLLYIDYIIIITIIIIYIIHVLLMFKVGFLLIRNCFSFRVQITHQIGVIS